MRRFLIVMTVLFMARLSTRADAGDLVKSSVLEDNVAYLRVGTVGKNLPGELQSAQGALAATNTIDGIVLDLRFAGGDDAESAKAAANSFASKKVSLAVLINGETRGAAMELARELRDAHTGLIFGSAVSDLKPDVSVAVDATDEKDFVENPYGVVATNQAVRVSRATNDILPVIDHTTEADLVHARIKDGDEDENTASERPVEPLKPFIRDPVLVRGLDFIKGLAVFRLSHS